MTLLAILLGCGEATLVAPDQPGPDGHWRWSSSHEGGGCDPGATFEPGHLTGASGTCRRIGGEWVFDVDAAPGRMQCGTATCSSPFFSLGPAPSPGVTALDPRKDRWKLDDPWLVPNSPSSCAGVFFTLPAETSCTRGYGVEIVGLGEVEGQCTLSGGRHPDDSGPMWVVDIRSAAFRGDVHCEVVDCSSPSLRIGPPDARPHDAVMGTWLAAVPADDGHGHVSKKCREATFPGDGIADLFTPVTPPAPPRGP